MVTSGTDNKIIKTSVAKLTLVEDHIILFQTDENADFGLAEMLEVREANNILSNGKPYCVVMESGEFTTFSSEAKESSASEEHTKNRIALALVKSSLAVKLVVDLYLKLNKPVGPTKTFKDKQEAFTWLRLMRDNYYKGLQ